MAYIWSATEATVTSTKKRVASSNGNTGSESYKTKAGLCSVLAKQVELSTSSAAGKSISQSF